jgi:hypothetical protein
MKKVKEWIDTTLNAIRTGVNIALLVILLQLAPLFAELFEKYFWRFQ